MADIILDTQSTPTTPSAGKTALYVDTVLKTLKSVDDTGTVTTYGSSIATPVTVPNGGTGDTTLTAHGVLVGNGTSAVSVTGVGATNTVLHGNTGADPTYSAIVNGDIANSTIDLAAKVTGILPSANGGTANGFTKFSGPSSSEKTFTLPNASATILTDNAAVTVPQGGTGLATLTTAYGLVAAGTTATGALQNVGTGTTGYILTSGGSAALPTYVATGAPVVSVLTDGSTPALDASLGTVFTLAAAGDRTIAVPSNPTSGQKIVIRHLASGGARTLALNAGAGGFRFGTDITGLTLTASGKYDYIGCIYNAAASFWDVVAYTKGF